MRVIDRDGVDAVLDFGALIEELRVTFAGRAVMPRRSMFPLDDDGHDTLGVQSAWTDHVIAIKAFTHMPENAARGGETVHATVVLFDRETGEAIAAIDGTSITYWRTAAVSALAADYLARPDAHTLLLCGTGGLAPYMALAHAAVRPIERVLVWGRSDERAKRVVARLQQTRSDLECEVTEDRASAARAADVITCATGSPDPLILGAWVRPGTHVDLVGNHDRHGRECDSALVERARVYVDTRINVLSEAGELLIPISEGRFDEARVAGELAELCAERVAGRTKPDEITLFKSVGTALSDLAAAQLVARLHV